jgi:hypothetical protein
MSTTQKFKWVAEVKEVIEWRLVDENAPPPSIVYILQCEETSRFKIGITQNFEQRFKDIQSMCATKLRCVFKFPAASQNVETCLHKMFEPYRLHGEWFAIPQREIHMLDSLMFDYELRIDPSSDGNKDGIYKDEAINQSERGLYEIKPQPMKEFYKAHRSRYEMIIAQCPENKS